MLATHQTIRTARGVRVPKVRLKDIQDGPTPDNPFPMSVMPRSDEYKVTKTLVTKQNGKPIKDGCKTYRALLLQRDDVLRVYDVYDDSFPAFGYDPDEVMEIAHPRRVQLHVPAWQCEYTWHVADRQALAYPKLVELEEEKAMRSVKNAYFKYFIEKLTKERVRFDDRNGRLVVPNALAITPDLTDDRAHSRFVMPRRNIQYTNTTATTVTNSIQVVGNRWLGEPINETTLTGIANDLAVTVNGRIARAYVTDATGGTASITVNDNNLYYNDLTYTDTITIDTTGANDIIWNGQDIRIVYNTAVPYVQSTQDAVKNAIRKNIGAPAILKSKGLLKQISPEEQKARDTLRDMISEAQYRRYLTNGFIMVRGVKSGHF